jgi:hypothetical protein
MNHKYEIIESTGCTKFGFSINGKELNDLPENEIEEVIDYLLPKIKESIKNKEINLSTIMHIFPYAGYEHTKEPCGQCGDHVTITVWRI